MVLHTNLKNSTLQQQHNNKKVKQEFFVTKWKKKENIFLQDTRPET